VLQTYMNARRAELRHYVDLAVSTVQPLYDGGAAATRRQAIQRLAALDYGSDGYFFVYDLDGEVLMRASPSCWAATCGTATRRGSPPSSA
jgi:two-component system NarL family sensor kinase